MAFLWALRELELFHSFPSKIVEWMSKIPLCFSVWFGVLRWSAARVEIQRASGSRRGGRRGVFLESDEFPWSSGGFLFSRVEISAISTQLTMSIGLQRVAVSLKSTRRHNMYVVLRTYKRSWSSVQSLTSKSMPILIEPEVRWYWMLVHNRYSCYPRASSCDCMQMISHSK